MEEAPGVAYARAYSNKRKGDCKLIHSHNTLYGENLYWGSRVWYWSVKDAVDDRVPEKQWYSYDRRDKCAGTIGR
ncbi:hypothetical protein CDL15_Pgr023908 [Punica granatum]|nr:hypothetical protein CDL15_Pgr023908 [Punica granatum]